MNANDNARRRRSRFDAVRFALDAEMLLIPVIELRRAL
jgi:hypothetical protein